MLAKTSVSLGVRVSVCVGLNTRGLYPTSAGVLVCLSVRVGTGMDVHVSVGTPGLHVACICKCWGVGLALECWCGCNMDVDVPSLYVACLQVLGCGSVSELVWYRYGRVHERWYAGPSRSLSASAGVRVSF